MKSLPWHLTVTLILLAAITTSRKLKRKDSYRYSVPLPPPLPPAPIKSPSSASSAPYQFEDISQGEFSSPSSVSPIQRYEKDYGTIHLYHPHHHAHQHTETSVSGGSTFFIDNGLRSIAKGSADQANSAVINQNAAGKQAAYVAKSTLAQAATQAAGTAVAVLKGKELLLQRLEEQNLEALKVLESELAQLQQAKRSAKAAQYAAHQAINHVTVLTAALNNAQKASELTQKSASEAAAELASQIDMVAHAKAKLEQVESLLYSTRLDFEETKDAAEKATLSAQEAQINANDAAVHANVELSETALKPQDNDDHNLDFIS